MNSRWLLCRELPPGPPSNVHSPSGLIINLHLQHLAEGRGRHGAGRNWSARRILWQGRCVLPLKRFDNNDSAACVLWGCSCGQGSGCGSKLSSAACAPGLGGCSGCGPGLCGRASAGAPESQQAVPADGGCKGAVSPQGVAGGASTGCSCGACCCRWVCERCSAVCDWILLEWRLVAWKVGQAHIRLVVDDAVRQPGVFDALLEQAVLSWMYVGCMPINS